MTRVEVKEFLESLGIESPTKDQIDSYLNKVNGEIQREKDKSEKYRQDSDKVAELQRQLDELNNANLSDIEKANKATESANNKIAELEKQISQMNTKNSLLANGIKDEEADKIIESLNGGNFDASILGAIIADRTKSAIADFEKKALEGTPNPSGGKADDKGKAEDTEMDKAVELAKNALGGADKTTDIINAYK